MDLLPNRAIRQALPNILDLMKDLTFLGQLESGAEAIDFLSYFIDECFSPSAVSCKCELSTLQEKTFILVVTLINNQSFQ